MKDHAMISEIKYSHTDGESWTDTTVEYICGNKYSLKQGDKSVVTCKVDGNWDAEAPTCLPC